MPCFTFLKEHSIYINTTRIGNDIAYHLDYELAVALICQLNLIIRELERGVTGDVSGIARFVAIPQFMLDELRMRAPRILELRRYENQFNPLLYSMDFDRVIHVTRTLQFFGRDALLWIADAMKAHRTLGSESSWQWDAPRTPVSEAQVSRRTMEGTVAITRNPTPREFPFEILYAPSLTTIALGNAPSPYNGPRPSPAPYDPRNPRDGEATLPILSPLRPASKCRSNSLRFNRGLTTNITAFPSIQPREILTRPKEIADARALQAGTNVTHVPARYRHAVQGLLGLSTPVIHRSSSNHVATPNTDANNASGSTCILSGSPVTIRAPSHQDIRQSIAGSSLRRSVRNRAPTPFPVERHIAEEVAEKVIESEDENDEDRSVKRSHLERDIFGGTDSEMSSD